ncbi:hypothetical protein [Streptomyces griseofuscus]|uniref:Uncharacterized protein n=1 Tax=Streptomyces griseofuscus TaxID=146922 RepID=A0A7H1Q3Q6_9ACTN|nr:hypothetical protein [Streptomyces griseofuscus]QNT94936.1 hypothetical protein HEP81_04664 [Streptomyces griseofuscus]
MFHRNSDRSERKGHETRLTPGRRRLLAAAAVSTAGLGLGFCVVVHAVTPDEATALSKVGSSAAYVVALVMRRGPGSGPGGVALGK